MMTAPAPTRRWSAGGLACIAALLAAVVLGVGFLGPRLSGGGDHRPKYWRLDMKTISDQCGQHAVAVIDLDRAYVRDGHIAVYPSTDGGPDQTVDENDTRNVHCYVQIPP